MRLPVIYACVVVCLAATAAGDTIHLKNGRTILADSVQEKKGRIEYYIGDNTYAISKQLVERIDTDGAPEVTPPAELPLPAAPETPTQANELAGKVVRDGRVDPDALLAAEKQGSPEAAAMAYLAAARHEQQHGAPEKARFYLQRALDYVPNSPVILEHYASVLLQMGSYSKAAGYAQRAARLAPNSADAFLLLGYAYFYSERTREAIPALKRALELRPDPSVGRLLAKAEREQAAESDFTEQESGHFVLRYQGHESSAGIRHQVLSTLESHYDELVRELGVAPRESIAVILYTEQTFFDVTQAPSWSGAINDGKLRIPIEGVQAMTPELSRVLKHELAHSFIAQITHNRCPAWLDEGVAMELEPRALGEQGRAMSRLFASQRAIPLSRLEGSFLGLSDVPATVAYLESLATVEYLRKTYGMSDVVRILQRIGEGAPAGAALRTTIHAGYGQLEIEVGEYLKKVYGE